MFTTTISVNSIYNTSSVVMVPIVWLYMTVVVVVISFSIIMLCSDISLLLVTVGIVYSRAGKIISVVISILFDGENISFDARYSFPLEAESTPGP